MIAHVSIGVRDIDRSKRFYDTVLEPLGYKCLRAARTLQGYGYGRDSIALWVVHAEHTVPADEKSGLHFCFTRRMPPPSMRFTQPRCALAGVTTVHPACVRYMAPITTPRSSLTRTDTGSRRTTVQARRERVQIFQAGDVPNANSIKP
jgi:hypothetical protein